MREAHTKTWPTEADLTGRMRKGSYKIPPVVGDIMLKRRDIHAALKEPKFTKTLSLGSGLSGEQKGGLAGCFAIDKEGNLVARYLGVQSYPGQTLITLYPVADIADEIVSPAKGAKGLKHPLSAADNPLDPVMLDLDYTESMTALMQRDWVTSRRLVKGLMKRHPNSLMLQGHAASLMSMDPEETQDRSTRIQPYLQVIQPKERTGREGSSAVH